MRLLAVLATALLVVTTARTFRLESRQVDPGASPELPSVDARAEQRLAEALRFETVSAHADDEAVVQAFSRLGAWMEAAFPRTHQLLELETFDRFGRLYRWEGTDPELRPILLAAHLDVVPVEPGTEDQWTHPPFGGVIDDGYIWGRGAMDDKVSAVAILEAVEHMLESGMQPRRTVYLAFGHDEEVGGAQGARAMAEALRQRGVELEFVLDEGGVLVDSEVAGTKRDVALVGVAEKGYASVRLEVEHEEGGHSSMPPRQTAIGIIAEAIRRVERSPMPAEIRGPTEAMFETLAPEMTSAVRRFALANRWLLDPLLLSFMEADPAANASIRTTHAATQIEGGTAANVLPTRARAVVNFRIAPGDTIEDVLQHVAQLVADLPVELRLLEGARNPTLVSDHESESFETLARTIRRRYPETIVTPYLTIAGTDARHYQPVARAAYRFLPIRFAAGDRHRVHGSDERISTQSYRDAIAFYMGLMLSA